MTLIVLGLSSCASPAPVDRSCAQELQSIRKADQQDRQWQADGRQPTQKELEQMASKDEARLKRVGEISGCLKSAADFEAAFLIFQHGNTPDHFFQAYLWAKEAIQLGMVELKSGMAMAVDRYLVSVGKKQLFGTQATQSHVEGCWCILPMEESFPDKLRTEYRGGRNAAYTGTPYLRVLNQGRSCPNTYCQTQLKPSVNGSVPGFW